MQGFTSLKTSKMERMFVLERYNKLSDDEKKRFHSGALDSKAVRVGPGYFPDYCLKDKDGKILEVG